MRFFKKDAAILYGEERFVIVKDVILIGEKTDTLLVIETQED